MQLVLLLMGHQSFSHSLTCFTLCIQLLIFATSFFSSPMSSNGSSCLSLCFQWQISFPDKQTIILSCRRYIMKCSLDQYLWKEREWKEEGSDKGRRWAAMQGQQKCQQIPPRLAFRFSHSSRAGDFISFCQSVFDMCCSLGEVFFFHQPTAKKITTLFLRG